MTDLPYAPTDAPADAHDDHHGPSDIYYVRIALALTILTSIEVAWSYLPVWDDATGFLAFAEVAGLLAMMAVKFVVIASNFMHLKFDDKILSRIFYGGLFLAVGVYVVTLTTFSFWQS